MQITEEQKRVLDSLVVERLCGEHKGENLRLVQSFSNPKNPTLEKMIKSQRAIDKDSMGAITYYLVKSPNGELLMYFSLKCGELFKDLDVQKLMLAQQTAEAIEVLQERERFTEEKAEEAMRFIQENMTEIKNILPNIDQYLQKKKLYSKDLSKELNPNMQRVLNTHPAVELVEFCANENGRDAWKRLGIERKMGECVFWHVIVPKLLALQNIVGCEFVYLFAADRSYDGDLVNYYRSALGFRQPVDLGANKPQYDFQCFFLCQRLEDLQTGQQFFYDHFTLDDEV